MMPFQDSDVIDQDYDCLRAVLRAGLPDADRPCVVFRPFAGGLGSGGLAYNYDLAEGGWRHQSPLPPRLAAEEFARTGPCSPSGRPIEVYWTDEPAAAGCPGALAGEVRPA